MEIRILRTFQVVAEELNLTKAAMKLNYSQPTVTKHIKSLEDELETLLLEKRNGKYVLTYAGEQLYKSVINILKEVNTIKNIPTEYGANFIMRLQAHDYYCFRYFIPAIRQMSKVFPTVSFKINGSSNEETISQLLKNEVDIGIVSGNIVSSDLQYEIIGFESVALCINSNYYRKSYRLEDYFEKYPIIIDQSEYYNYHNFFQKSLNNPQIIDSSSDEVVQQAILNDCMLGIVRTGRLQTYIDSGEIVVIDEITKRDPINVVINKASIQNESIKKLYTIIITQQTSIPKIGKKIQWI